MSEINAIYKYPKDSNIILKSKDDILFYVSRLVLMSNSTVFHAHLADTEHMEEIPINYTEHVIEKWLRLFHSTRDRYISNGNTDPGPPNLSKSDHETVGDVMLMFNEYDINTGAEIIGNTIRDIIPTLLHDTVLINIFKYEYFKHIRSDELCYELLHRNDEKKILQREPELLHAIMQLFNVHNLVKSRTANWSAYKTTK